MRKEDLFPDMAPADPVSRIRGTATKIRTLRTQVGPEGLTPSATRTLIEQLSQAMDEIANALEKEGPA